MIFELKNTGILQAVKIKRRPVFRFTYFLAKLLLTIGLFFFFGFSFAVLTGRLSSAFLDRLLAGSCLAFSFGFLFLEFGIFFKGSLKEPKLIYSLHDLILRPNYINSASFLDLEAAQVCFKAQKLAKKQKCKEPGSLHLLLALSLSKSDYLDFVFNRIGISRKELRKRLIGFCKQASEQAGDAFKTIIFKAAEIAEQRQSERITIGHILISLAENEPFFKDFLFNHDLKTSDIAEVCFWHERTKAIRAKEKKFWLKENLAKHGSLGRDFAAGFSLSLDKFSIDLKQVIIKKGVREIIGHQEEIKRTEAILSKKDLNNALLVGQPGSGRRSVVEAVAQRAFLGVSPESISYKRFLEFDLSLLTSQITSQEQTEEVLDRCLAEAVRAGNIVLVINDFHNFAAEIIKLGTLNVSAIISRYLPLSSFQIIAITSYDGLHKILERNPSLLNLFEKVEIAEISIEETMRFLENYAPFFESRSKRFITYKSLREITKLCSRYFTQTPFPEKAIRLLDEAVSYLTTYTNESVLEVKHIQKLVSQKIEMPLGEMEAQEKTKLLNLEKLIHQRIINQGEAVKQISSALRRARSEIKTRKGPMGSFLFLGPTGVGKTETCKALAHIYFKSEKKMHRLDMTEFQNIEDIFRLIGSDSSDGLLTTKVREEPFSLVLLDEIEKAHPNILNLFLQVLDEGFITDGTGRKVDFQETIVIATSNAGAEIIRQDILEDKKLDIIKDDLLDHLLRSNIFRPEFINRFDSVVVFKPLSEENLLDIAQLMLEKLADNLKDKGIYFEITLPLKEKIVKLSYNPVFGAREIRRVIQEKVENPIAQALLSNKIIRGNRVTIDPENFEVKKVG